MLNLLADALTFPEPGGRLATRCDVPRVGASGRGVQIEVTHTVIGIAPEKVLCVSSRWCRSISGSRTGREGTGLGLAISRDMACGMGDDLTAESTIDVGSTFILVILEDRPIPRAAAPPAVSPA